MMTSGIPHPPRSGKVQQLYGELGNPARLYMSMVHRGTLFASQTWFFDGRGFHISIWTPGDPEVRCLVYCGGRA